ncbi:MAG: ParB/RepB/Spo0J family partition protein [Parvibaculaceae bacterium]|nr:ParB/RepB/Spo0J family partition protein [Parvibaculaceae bacterium]
MTHIDTIALRAALTQSLEQANKTRTACAREAGIDGSNLSKFLKGNDRYRPHTDTWVKIASTLPGTRIAAIFADLFPDAFTVQAEARLAPDGFIELAHDQIQPDPANYRKTIDRSALTLFAEEIAKDGLLAPLVVRPAGDCYRIIAGERRWRAIGIAIENGWWNEKKPVPCTVRNVDEKEARALSIIENLQREDVPRMEEARGFHELKTLHGLSTETIAQRLGASKTYVQQQINLIAKLSDAGQAALSDGHINFEQARILWTLPKASQAVAVNALPQGWEDEWQFDDALTDALAHHPVMRYAHFDPKSYKGETFKLDGTTYAESAETFEAAQQEALKATLERLKNTWAEVRTGTAYFTEWNFDKTKRKAEGFAYVQIVPPTGDNGFTMVKVHEGYRQKETKAPGKQQDANGLTALELTQRQVTDVANLKTIMLQKNLSNSALRIPLAIATGEILCNLATDHKYQLTPCLISVEGPPRESPSKTTLPIWKDLLAYLTPLVQAGIITSLYEDDDTDDDSDGESSPPTIDYDWQTRVDRAAVFTHLLEHPELEKIFTLCIAITTGCWPQSSPGDDPIAVAIANATGTSLAGAWRMTDAYLKPFTIAGLHRVADVCGYSEPILSGDRPAKKAELISWILEHPERHSTWLPPELHYGYRADITADVAAWLNGAPAGLPEDDQEAA